MVLPPLPQPAGADSSSMERVPPPILTTPGGMSLDLSRPPRTVSVREASLWESNFQLLLQFKRREGHLRVLYHHVEDGKRLGAWISLQRIQKRLGTLCPESLRRFNEIGFIWNPLQAKWDTMFRVLTQFKQREGHLRVPVLHVEDGKRLGVWIGWQRVEKRLGTLISERDRRLNEIGFIWKAREAQSVKTAPGGMPLHLSPPRPSQAARWDFNFLLLLQFRDREGHLSVPQHHVEGGKKLGRWMSMNRTRQKAGILWPERLRRLNEIGFIWKPREAQSVKTSPGGLRLNLSPPRPSQASRRWDFNFLLLQQFRDRVGHMRVPLHHVEDGKRLGAWISKQRAHKRLGTLVSERDRRLNEIGFIWKPREAKSVKTSPDGRPLHLSPPCPSQAARWDFNFLLLLQFRDREGHLRVPLHHVEDGKRLGAWISNQRTHKRLGTLVSERDRRLNEIGFIWKAREAQSVITTPGGMRLNLSPPCPSHARRWDFNFLLLLQFRDREGHLRVPRCHVEDGNRLGAWIRSQRVKQKAGTLVSERLLRLNEIGLNWDERKEKSVAMITALAQFKQRKGHCNVSTNHTEHLDDGVKLKLGLWLVEQRYQQRHGTINAEREKQLASLGVKWHSQRQEMTEEPFDRNFDLLLVFKEREGHVRVPFEHQESAADNLGAWLAAQWSLHRIGALELDRKTRLEVAGVTWE
jgi:ribosomal protein L7Ae-like RNA K-turn-binding protein